MTAAPSPVQQANLDVIVELGPLTSTGFANPRPDLFAADFVFHFCNPQLPELDGDHHGVDGLVDMFTRLADITDTEVRSEPKSLTPFGDELVVVYATHTLGLGGALFDVDAIVVWRVFEGRIHEGWDIPAVNTVRPRPAVAD